MNVKTILKVAFPYILVWLAFMVIPALAGQPEVIVATPCGLILALAAGTGVGVAIGRRAGMQSTSIVMMQLTLAEAILAGALVGAFQGLLFGVWAPVLMLKEEGGEVVDTVVDKGEKKMKSKKCLSFIVIAVALGSAILVACGAPVTPTPVPTPAASPTPSASEHLNRGADYADQGQLDQAIAEYQEAIRLDPDYAEAHYNLGLAYHKQGKLDDAIAEYKEAIRIDPSMADAHVNLGVAYADQGKLDEAIAAYREALRINPDLGDAHLNLGLAYHDQGRWDEAISEYKEVIRINPDDADAYYNLGLAYYMQDRLDEAIVAWKESIRLKPRDSMAHNNLGRAYFEQGRLDEAVVELKEAIRLDSENARAHFNLGLVYYDQGRVDEAIAELETYLQLIPPDAPDRAKVEEWIEQLKTGLTAEYRNAAGGYSLLCPEGWYYVEREAEVMFVAKEEDLDVLVHEAPMILFAAGLTSELADHMGLDEITAQDLDIVLQGGAVAMGGEAGEITYLEIAGYPAAIADFSGTYEGSPYEGTLAFVFMDDRCIRVVGMGPPDQWGNVRPTFVAMVNSLTFFEP
jgi:tetratricopeptide (TPR) repeat protein